MNECHARISAAVAPPSAPQNGATGERAKATSAPPHPAPSHGATFALPEKEQSPQAPAGSDARGLAGFHRREIVVACTALAFGLSRRGLMQAGRDRPRAVLARQVAMYLLHVAFSLSMQEVGRLFRRDRSTVAHACRRIEEWREQEAADAFLHHLEAAIRALDAAIYENKNRTNISSAIL
jgi:hypothetical protein